MNPIRRMYFKMRWWLILRREGPRVLVHASRYVSQNAPEIFRRQEGDTDIKFVGVRDFTAYHNYTETMSILNKEVSRLWLNEVRAR